jgi:hypothetical protein
MASILGNRRARTLYNLADARLPESLARAADGARLDVLPALERTLRHQGLGAIRRTWLLLALLEYWPILAGPRRRRYWRLDTAARRESVMRLQRLPLLGDATRELLRRIEEAAAATRDETGAAHSLDGA